MKNFFKHENASSTRLMIQAISWFGAGSILGRATHQALLDEVIKRFNSDVLGNMAGGFGRLAVQVPCVVLGLNNMSSLMDRLPPIEETVRKRAEETPVTDEVPVTA